MALVDQYGRPIKTGELTKEIAAPTLAGIRTLWDSSVASGLTPVGLAGLLMDAAQGDHDAFLTLAEEMEERDLHYGSELSKRKLAVSRLPINVESATDSDHDKKLADEVSKLVRKPGFRMLLKDLLDGLGKGYSVAEIMWDRSGSQWKPKEYRWRDPHFFQFERIARTEIRLRDEADSFDGLALAPFKFITHVPKIKSGIPIRGGLARLAAWAYMCKGYTVKDWLAFAEVFGMPLRMGKYGSNASKDDIAILKMAVANLGIDAAAVFPESMQIELVEAGNKGSSADFFVTLANYLDDQVSKGILGQTASSSGTPGKLGNEELQGEVRDDIRDDDAEQLSDTINRDLVKVYIDLNWGPQEEYPTVSIAQADAEDIAALVEALGTLVPLGLRVEQSVVRDKIGIAEPAEDAKPEDLLTVPAGKISNQKSEIADSAVPAAATNQQRALNAEQQPQPDTADIIAAKLSQGAQPTVDDMIAQIRTLLGESASLEDFRDQLIDLNADLDPAQLGDLIAKALLLGDLAGRDEARQEGVNGG
ncbi:DUF935 domain-containing protein [uncultured Desulfuromusa sp.]|uniref:DUF935 domain-containing protein n=1 Tax=uncultured Desulfuromusa sp. TaxID=219183 RepID=UPI002AA90A6B|nr:DUF935 domain-containing protein [uncultured Desulfuromusa sp.]